MRMALIPMTRKTSAGNPREVFLPFPSARGGGGSGHWLLPLPSSQRSHTIGFTMHAQNIIFQIRTGGMTYAFGEEFLKDYGYSAKQVFSLVAAQSKLDSQSKGNH